MRQKWVLTRKQISKSWQLYAILLIPIIWLIIFRYLPMAGIILAFKDFSARKGILKSPWAGLRYFKMFFGSANFWTLIRNTLNLSVYYLIAGFPIPIILAITLNECSSLRFKKITQTITFAPYFISTVVLVGILSQILHIRFGLVNNFLNMINMKSVDFMGTNNMFQHLYVWSGIWQSAGYSSVIYIAALGGIDIELREAATIDGANRIQRVWNIDLPGIMPTIIITLLLNMGGLMSVGFEKVYLLQNPSNLATSEIISTYVYKIGLISAQYSFATAIGLFNSVINFVLLASCNLLSRKISETSLW